jgi:phosphatidylglycerol:prolipoprotein diacylglycerol transferase
MITINVDPIAFRIGPLAVHWYGLMYIVGIIIGLFVAWPYARSKGLRGDQLEKVVYWAVPAGLVGARLYYVLQQPLGEYLHNPGRIFAFWEGGMAFFGAIFAVAIVLFVAGWKMRFSVLKLLDAGAIFAVVGQFFGRIGNIINGDVIGYPTGLPWGFVYANPDSFAPRHDIAYQPAAVYEALINVILFGLLWWLRNKFRPGVLFFLYVVLYSLSQIIVFFWRDNVVLFAGLKQAQLTSIGVIIAAVLVFWLVAWWQSKHPSPEPEPASLEETPSSPGEEAAPRDDA